jgi:surfeit locus 1 family protein
VAASAIALGLGLWQLQRRATKAELIAAIEARAGVAPQPLPDPSEWPSLRPGDYDYRHVVLEGIFAHDKEVLIFRASGGGTTGVTEPGYLVLTPLRLATGAFVVVNRGFVSYSSLGGIARGDPARASVTRVTGLMRAPEARNLFTPSDNLAHGRGFTRDPAAIAAHFGLDPSAPFSIDADASANWSGWPKGGTTELRIPDNHLSYALTWFGLAATGAAVLGTLAWTRRPAPT